MKKLVLFLALSAVLNVFAVTDRSAVYCHISNSSSVITLQSRVTSTDGAGLPDTYFTGNNSSVTRDFSLGKNRLKFKFYFPPQENGRSLNASTTVHVSIFLNGNEIVNTKHFGQPSDFFVNYSTNILCRPKVIYVVLNNKNEISVRFMGVYIPLVVRQNKDSWGKADEKRFELDYTASSSVVDDLRLAISVLTNTDKPNGGNSTTDKKNYSLKVEKDDKKGHKKHKGKKDKKHKKKDKKGKKHKK